MNNSRISVRYAKALFSLAIEDSKADKVNKDAKLFMEACDIPDFKLALENPVILPSKKMKIFEAIFKGKVDELSLKFLNLLTKNGREEFLKDISRNYLSLYRKHYGINSVVLTTAFQINKKLKSEIIQILKKRFDTEIELNEIIDEKIVGGFIIKVEDKLIDASIKGKLKKLKSELNEVSLN